MIFEEDFLDFIELLNKYKVEYLIIEAMHLPIMADLGIQAISIFGSFQIQKMLQN